MHQQFFFFLFVDVIYDMLQKVLCVMERKGLMVNNFEDIFNDSGDDRLQTREDSYAGVYIRRR